MPNFAVLSCPAVRFRICGALNPPQLLLSVDRANLRVSFVPKGDPAVKVILSEAFPPTGQNALSVLVSGEVPVSVIVPTKGEPLFFTVKKPLSIDAPGVFPSIQIFSLLLQVALFAKARR